MIHRALKLRFHLDTLLMEFADGFEDDTLSEDNWDQLKDLESILAPFQEITQEPNLEGRATVAYYGSMWGVLPAVESLIKYLDAMKTVYTIKSHPKLGACLNIAWAKLDSYYARLDKTPAYTSS
jgi:hypothetical protein